MTLDPEQLRRAMRAWTTGVTVVTAIHEGQQYGMTVNSFTSISLEPPLISVALRQLTHTHELVEKSGEFAITILASNQGGLSDRFAGKIPEIADRFEGVQTSKLLIDAPLLKGGIGLLELPRGEFDPRWREYALHCRGHCGDAGKARATRWCITTEYFGSW